MAVKVYNLRRGLPSGSEPDWLQEFETWIQRSRTSVVWRTTQVDAPGSWSAQPIFNGQLVPGIIGYGNTITEAKRNAVRQLEEEERLTIGSP
ncbi:hypothetical protein FRC09_000437 [Ceratobasidium sp. 395]|nr:hypothetical protein FRC09_000437 [Ceratobasidium sp. 395]